MASVFCQWDEGGDPGASQEYSLTRQLVQGDE